MKRNLVLISVIIVSFSLWSCSGKKGKGKYAGASFNFEKFEFSTKGMYSEIDQSAIKALKLTFRELSDTSAANIFLFRPELRDNNRISLFDLLTWAIEEKNLTVYDFFSDYFTEPVKPEVLSERLQRCKNVRASLTAGEPGKEQTNTINSHSGVINYVVMESTITGTNGNVISRRPIGICPILISYDNMVGRVLRRPLFWAYFPDLMVLLSQHFPEIKTEKIKTTLDFFTTNSYQGRLLPEYNSFSPLVEGKFYGDTSRYMDGVNVEWIYNHVKDGIYIEPSNKLFQGNGKQYQAGQPDSAPEPELSINLIASAKHNDYTINLRTIENYPLYFPETPSLGQKSLIDVIYNGLKDGKLTANSVSILVEPLSLKEVEAAMGKITKSIRIQVSPDKTADTLITVDFKSPEIKKYIIKETEFYDAKGTLLGSRIYGLIPVREIINEVSGKTTYDQLFVIPLNNQDKRKVLSSEYTYRFNPDDNISYLTFLQEKKYKAESVKSEKVSPSTALKDIGYKK